MTGIYNDISETIGRTPLVRINRMLSSGTTEILAKLEFFNPSGSLKDRIGLAMIEAAQKEGKIHPDTVIIEPTSGNTGIALACICAARGLRLILTMPESMSLERRQLFKLMGAEVVLTPADLGMRGAIDQAYKILKSEKKGYIPNQFDNAANPQAHAETTAQEILEDTLGQVDVLVAGVGTGGSLTGIARRLRETLPKLHVIAVEPETSPVLSGGMPGPHSIQGIGAGFTPPVLDTRLINDVARIGDQRAIAMARMCAQKEGIACGISSGAVLAAGLEWAVKKPFLGKRFVLILPDFAERYLSTELFREG